MGTFYQTTYQQVSGLYDSCYEVIEITDSWETAGSLSNIVLIKSKHPTPLLLYSFKTQKDLLVILWLALHSPKIL